jgi:DNA-binding NarL/FixJ family response regulator
MSPLGKLISKRERQVLFMLSRGLTTKRIAEELDVSVRTVESHRKNLFRKCGVKNMAALIRVGYDKNLLP